MEIDIAAQAAARIVILQFSRLIILRTMPNQDFKTVRR